MTRKEGAKWNSEAGVDLFEYVYNVLGLKNRGVFFVGNKMAAYEKIVSRKVSKEHIRLAVENDELAACIFEDFEKNAPPPVLVAAA